MDGWMDGMEITRNNVKCFEIGIPGGVGTV